MGGLVARVLCLFDKEDSRFRVSSGRSLQIRATVRTWCKFSVVERSRCPFAPAGDSLLLSLPLGAEGGWRQGSGGRDGVGPSRFRLVMLTPSRCLLVVVTITLRVRRALVTDDVRLRGRATLQSS